MKQVQLPLKLLVILGPKGAGKRRHGTGSYMLLVRGTSRLEPPDPRSPSTGHGANGGLRRCDGFALQRSSARIVPPTRPLCASAAPRPEIAYGTGGQMAAMIDSFTLVSIRSIGHDALRSVVRPLSIPAPPAKGSAAAPQSLV